MDFEQFSSDDKTTFAVVRALESSAKLQESTRSIRARHQSITWQDMAEMRDKPIHEYFGVDLTVVWKTATEDLPVVKPLIKQVLPQT